MRTRAVAATFVLVGLLAPPARAQQPSTPIVAVEDVRTPDTPAFVLLGIAPSLVERPSTPSALSIDLLSTFASSENVLPTHYAIEIAPYWLAAHRALERAAYEHPGVGRSMAQTLSLSFATSRPAKRVAPDAIDIGAGVRVAMFAGHAGPRLDELAGRLASLQLEYQILDLLTGALPTADPRPPSLPATLAAVFDRLDAHPEIIQMTGLTREQQNRVVATVKRALMTALQTSDDPARDALAALQASVEQRMQNAARRVAAEDLRRRGWMLTLAGAAVSRVPGGTETGVARSRLLRWGAWATPAYRLAKPDMEVIAVIRVTADREHASRLVDVGGRVAHQIGSFSWSGEYVQRVAQRPAPARLVTERVAFTFEYLVAHGLVLTAALGRDFAEPAPDGPGGLVSQLGLRIAFGRKPTVQLAP